MDKANHNNRNWVHLTKISLSLIVIILSFGLKGQTTLFSESFTTNNGLGQNQGTYDVTGVTTWSITKTGCSFGAGDYFYVNTGTGRFEVKGAFGATSRLVSSAVAIWSANAGAAIDISTYRSVSVSVTLGNASTYADGQLAQISTDGTTWVDIAYFTSTSTSTTYTVNDIIGTNLYFRINCWAVNSSSSSYFDDIIITGYGGQTKSTITATGAGSWVVPAGVTTAYVYGWGAGGGGGVNASGSNGGGGGGGGAVAYSAVAVTPGTTCYYSVGTGGAGAEGSPAGTAVVGGDTWFNKAANSAPGVSTNGILAKGGGLGGNTGGTGGTGGASGSCIGSTVVTGASGGNPGSGGGGGGGASATIVGITGYNSGTAFNGTAGSGSGTGLGGVMATGLGGSGGNGRSSGSVAGVAGTQPGGGGGGSDDVTSVNDDGGAGGAGQLIIIYTLPPTYYWVGGTGNWSDYSNHWSTTSGGAADAPNAPTASDNVIFDANSFTAPGQTVSIDADAYCKDMTWTGATNSPTLNFPALAPSYYDLYIAGSPTFIAAMSFTNNNAAYIYFTSTSTGKTITTNGLSMPCKFIFNGSGGEWTLQDNLTSSSTVWDFEVLTGASVISNGYTISGFGDLTVSGTGIFNIANGSASFSATATISGTVSISTGTLDVDDTFNATGGNVTFSGAGSLNLGGATNTSLGTFTESTGTVTYDRVSAQGVVAETYYNLVITGGGSAVKTAAGTVNVSNDLTINTSTTYAVAATTTTVTGASLNNGSLTISTGTFDAVGAYTGSGGSIVFTGAGNIRFGAACNGVGTFTASTSTVTWYGATTNNAAVRGGTTYWNVVIAEGTKGVSHSTPTVLNNLTVDVGAVLKTNSYTLKVDGTSDINGTLEISTGTFNADGTFDATGGNVTFTGAGNLNLGGATVTSLGTLTEATGTVSYDRAGSQSVLAETYYNLTIAGAGSAVKTSAGTVNVTNNMTVDASTEYNVSTATTTTVTGTSDVNGTLKITGTGIYDANGTFDATGGAVTFTGAGFLKLGGATVTSLGTTFTCGTGTVDYDYAGDQNIIATSYYNLTTTTSGIKSLTGTTYIGGAGALTVGLGTTLAIGSYTLDKTTFGTSTSTIAGTVTLSTGTWIPTYGASSALTTSGTITVTGTGLIYLKGGGAHTLGTFTCGTGTVYYDRNGAQTVVSATYYNIIFSNSDTKTLGGAIIVTNDLTIDASVTLDASVSDYGITVTGNWVNNGTFTAQSGRVTFTGSSNKTVSGSSNTSFYELAINKGTDITSVLDLIVPTTITYNVVFTAGLLRLTHASAIVSADYTNPTTDISSGAGLHVNGGSYTTGTNNVLNNSGYFRVTSGTATIGIATDNTFYNETATAILIVDGGTLNCAGRLRGALGSITISSGTVSVNTVGGESIATRGSFEAESGSDLAISGGTIILQTPNGNASGNDLYIVSGGTKTITGGTFQIGNASTAAAQSFKINSDLSLYNLTINTTNSPTGILQQNTTVSNNFINGGVFDAKSGSNYSLTIGGGFTNNGTFTARTGTVTFNGNSDQSIDGSSSTTFYNLTNSNTATTVTLNQGITVTNTLAMSGTADIDMNGNNIDLSSAGTITGETDADRIYDTAGTTDVSGVITTTRTLNAPAAVNVGGMGALITSAANLGSTTIKRGHIAQTGNLNTSIQRYYSITPTTNTGLSATLEFNYFDSELNGQTANEASFVLFRSTDGGVNWTNRGGTVNTAANNVTLTGIDAFSLWTPSSEVVSPLPISLISFNAIPLEDKIELKWVTASEVNSASFEIEKSINGYDFSLICSSKAAGNSNGILKYTDYDRNPIEGISYYRLKLIDLDGNYKYSKIVSVVYGAKSKVKLIPNPSNGLIATLMLKDLNYNNENYATIEVYSSTGELVYSKIVKMTNISFTISPEQRLAPGYYTVKLSQENKMIANEKMIVQW